MSARHSHPAWRLLAVATYVALACLRIPELLRHCRFWAEEGTVYFTAAWRLPWWQALVTPALGYLSLATNSAAVLARYSVPIEDAPCITTTFALAIQVIPACLLATASDPWLRRPAVLFAAIAILALPPGCDEVWLNTANSQFHLALAAALCLVLQTQAGWAASARNLLLFVCPLCSPASVALVPLFALRAVLDRDRRRAAQALCIATGSALQVLVFYTPFAGRGHIPDPATWMAIITVKHLALPFLGERGAAFIRRIMRGDGLSASLWILAPLAVGAAFIILLGAMTVLRRAEPAWLVAAGVAIACLSYCGAAGGGIGLTTAMGANRYIFAPCMLFALTVLACAALGSRLVSGCAWLVVIWLLAVATRQSLVQHDIFATGPRWRDEVARWKTDPGHRLAIWPAGQEIRLPHRIEPSFGKGSLGRLQPYSLAGNVIQSIEAE